MNTRKGQRKRQGKRPDETHIEDEFCKIFESMKRLGTLLKIRAPMLIIDNELETWRTGIAKVEKLVKEEKDRRMGWGNREWK